LDGTITKSDLRGQIFHTIGKGWFHNDVAELYDKISQNNYRFVYLSARSILQSRSSKNLINTVKQDEFSLPNGPLLLNPSSLLTSLTIELTNNSDDFKISCLNSLRQIFKTNPFFAGFGNKTTDLKTYKEIGIDENLIFIVNQTGFINNDLKLSYKKLINYVNFIFPKI
jgi:phosphatidate phosphatase LPIN